MTQTLQQWRATNKLTQAEAGARAGVAQGTWAKWEAGQVPPEQCLTVHGVTGIPLHCLRPDIYPESLSDRRKPRKREGAGV